MNVKLPENNVLLDWQITGDFSSITRECNNTPYNEGPSLITKRRHPACGIMTNGQQSKIVVAGGYTTGWAKPQPPIFSLKNLCILDWIQYA